MLISLISNSLICHTTLDNPICQGAAVRDAVWLGDLSRLQRLHESAPGCLAAPDERGGVAAHTAARRGQLDIFRFIYKVEPASINHVDNDGRTPIHYAVAASTMVIVIVMVIVAATMMTMTTVTVTMTVTCQYDLKLLVLRSTRNFYLCLVTCTCTYYLHLA